MRLRKNRRVERAAVNAARSFFEEHGFVFQEIDLSNDYGKDAYIDIVRGEVVTGTCIAAQIKGGNSYRCSGGYRIPIDSSHHDVWRNSSLPIAGIVHDPEDGLLRWRSITEFLRLCADHPKSILIPRENVLTWETLESDFVPQFMREAERYTEGGYTEGACVLDFFSTDVAVRQQAIFDSFAYGRSDPRVFIALRYALNSFAEDDLNLAIMILTHLTPHPDIMWSKSNWIPKEVCDAVCSHFRWSSDEIVRLLNTVGWESWQRGGMGEHLYMILREDPEIEEKMISAAVTAVDAGYEVAAFAAFYLSIYWAGKKSLEMYNRLISLRPEFELLPLVSEIVSELTTHGYVILFE